jgi:hypothetical protein
MRALECAVQSIQRGLMFCLKAHAATSRIDALPCVIRKMETNPVKKREGAGHE